MSDMPQTSELIEAHNKIINTYIIMLDEFPEYPCQETIDDYSEIIETSCGFPQSYYEEFESLMESNREVLFHGIPAPKPEFIDGTIIKPEILNSSLKYTNYLYLQSSAMTLFFVMEKTIIIQNKEKASRTIDLRKETLREMMLRFEEVGEPFLMKHFKTINFIKTLTEELENV